MQDNKLQYTLFIIEWTAESTPELMHILLHSKTKLLLNLKQYAKNTLIPLVQVHK